MAKWFVQILVLTSLFLDPCVAIERDSLCPHLLAAFKRGEHQVSESFRETYAAAQKLVIKASNLSGTEWFKQEGGAEVQSALAKIRETFFFADKGTQAAVLRILLVAADHRGTQTTLPTIVMAELQIIMDESLFWATQKNKKVTDPEGAEIDMKKRGIQVLRLLAPTFGNISKSLKAIQAGEPVQKVLIHDTVYAP